jgi:hypothetical protein
MQSISITTHPLHWSRGQSARRIASVVAGAVAVALLTAWIVTASLGLGVNGHSGIGPDRPPPPVMTP